MIIMKSEDFEKIFDKHNANIILDINLIFEDLKNKNNNFEICSYKYLYLKKKSSYFCGYSCKIDYYYEIKISYKNVIYSFCFIFTLFIFSEKNFLEKYYDITIYFDDYKFFCKKNNLVESIIYLLFKKNDL